MNHLDLFSGIGGFALAASWVWGDEHNIVSFVEIDPFCQKVLAKNFPGVPIQSDIKEYKHDGTNVDLITGGFPCQDVSCAGNQKGIYSERSGLWTELCKTINEVKPKFAIIENVTNLITGGNGMWFKCVICDLAKIGYDAEWHCLQAAQFGAPHQRSRIFITAYPKCESVNISMELSRIFTQSQWYKKEWCESWEQFVLVTDKVAPSKWWTKGKHSTRPLLVRNDDGVPQRVDRLKSLGNAIVPQCVQPIMQAIKDINENIVM